MPTKRHRVNLSVSPSRIRSALKFGDEQGMRAESGRLFMSSIFMNIITSILDLYMDPELKAYLNEKGGTFLSLIHESVRNHISSDPPTNFIER